MAVDDVCDIRIANPDDQTDVGPHGYMLSGAATMQDITPSAIKRTDGDPRFASIPTESVRAQADFSAGMGLFAGDDVASYYSGPADTTMGKQVICPQAGQPVGCPFAYYLWHEDGGPYKGMHGLVNNGSPPFAVARLVGTTWVPYWAFSVAPTGLARFRGKTYLPFGAASDVLVVDGQALTAASVLAGWKAEKLAAYGSMLYGIVAAGNTYKIQRYDPENNDLKDVAILPSGGEKPLGMLAHGGSLYIMMSRSLWSFTSQNGTVGTLIGPLDSWVARSSTVAVGPHPLATYQGALVYVAGNALRSYMPGGQARTLYPVAPRVGDANAWGTPFDLMALADRLYILTLPGVAGGWARATVLVWNGTQVCTAAILDHLVSGVVVNTSAQLAPASDGTVYAVVTDASVGLPPGNIQTFRVPYLTGDMRRDGPTLGAKFTSGLITSPWLDFGAPDVYKALNGVRVSQVRGFGGAAATVLVQIDEESSWRTLSTNKGAAVVQSSLTDFDTLPHLQDYVVPGGTYLRFRRLRWQIDLPPSPTQEATHLVDAVVIETDALMPLRNGFRFAIRVARDVQALDGQLMYPTNAAVQAALARLMAMRTDVEHADVAIRPNMGKPLTLTWLDGQDYLVRISTRTVTRQAWRADTGAVWVVTFDAREVDKAY